MAESNPAVRMVELTTCSSPYETSLVQGLLAEAGIPFEVDETSSQFAFTAGDLAVSRVRVAESDLERARSVISPGSASRAHCNGSPRDRPTRRWLRNVWAARCTASPENVPPPTS